MCCKPTVGNRPIHQPAHALQNTDGVDKGVFVRRLRPGVIARLQLDCPDSNIKCNGFTDGHDFFGHGFGGVFQPRDLQGRSFIGRATAARVRIGVLLVFVHRFPAKWGRVQAGNRKSLPAGRGLTQTAGMFRRLAPLVVLTLLSACVQDPSYVPIFPTGPPDDACRASQHAGLVGQDASVLERVLLLGPVRVIRPGMAMTEDYSPSRTNFEIDAANRITSVTCG